MNVIGVDVGGTEVKGVVLNREGQILDSTKKSTFAEKGNIGIMTTITNVIDELIIRNCTIEGIGIGSAGKIDSNSGVVVFATNNLLGWTGTNLRDLLQNRYSLKVAVDNDANVALIGEKWLGAGKGYDYITMLTLGTGVGGANMINGKIHHGAHWSSGDWGHVNMIPKGIPCNCGKQGCIEQYLSGTAFLRQANAITERNYLNGKDIFEDFIKGDVQIKKVVNDYIEYMTLGIEMIQAAIDPELIILGGGVVNSNDKWWDKFEKEKLKRGISIKVSSAKLNNQAGAIGAAKLIIDTLAGR